VAQDLWVLVDVPVVDQEPALAFKHNINDNYLI
jgi:hypothetical protein